MFRKLGDCAQALGAPHEAWAQLRCRRRKLFIAEELRLSTKLWPPFRGGMLSVAITPTAAHAPTRASALPSQLRRKPPLVLLVSLAKY